MLRGLMIGGAACLSVMVGADPALGAAIALKPGLEQGRKAEYDYTQTIKVQQVSSRPDAEPASEAHELDTKAHMAIEITKVSPDGTGEGTMRVVSISARQANPDGPMSVNFDFSKGAPAPGGEGIAALESAIAGSTFAFDIDAAGEVQSVRGLDRVQEAMAGAGQVPQTLTTFFDPAAMAQTLTVLFHAEGGIGDRELGSTWTTTSRVPFGAAGALELNTTNALQIADATIAAIAGATQIDLYVPREPGEGVPKVELGSANGQALTRWDPTRGGLISHVNTQNITSTWTLGDRKVEQTQTSKTEIKRSGD